MKCAIAALAAFVGYVFAQPALAELPPFDPPDADTMRAHFINVGQGAATLLEFSCGAALLDTGGEKNPGFRSMTN